MNILPMLAGEGVDILPMLAKREGGYSAHVGWGRGGVGSG